MEGEWSERKCELKGERRRWRGQGSGCGYADKFRGEVRIRSKESRRGENRLRKRTLIGWKWRGGSGTLREEECK